MTELVLLALLLIANGSPVVVRMLLDERLAWPLDGGVVLADDRPLFGASKTWAGLAAALVATTLSAPLFGLSAGLGLLLGGGAMAGDLFSSFVKRRLRLESGAMALGLDQVPESLLPLLLCQPLLALSWIQVALLTVAFLAANLLISQLMFRLGVGEHPY